MARVLAVLATGVLATDDKYVVKVHNTLSSFQSSASEVLAMDESDREKAFDHEMMTGKNGKQFMCFVPRPGFVEPQTSKKEKKKGPSTLESVLEQLHKLKGKCFHLGKDYWTYEFCPLKSISQYHVEGGKRGTLFSLGKYVSKDSFASTEPNERGIVAGKPGPSQQFLQRYEQGSEGRSTVVRFGCGQQKHAIKSIEENPRHKYNLYFETPLFCAPGNISTLLEPLHGQCLKKVEGWWTHELCFGHQVRQYHKGKNGTIEQEYIVGKFDRGRNKALEASGKALQQELLLDTSGDEEQVWTFAQQYNGGTLCDVTKQPRQVTVRHHCGPGVNHHITSIKEISTCQYVITVAVPALCTHAKFKRKSTEADGVVTSIHCVGASEWEKTVEELQKQKQKQTDPREN